MALPTSSICARVSVGASRRLFNPPANITALHFFASDDRCVLQDLPCIPSTSPGSPTLASRVPGGSLALAYAPAVVRKHHARCRYDDFGKYRRERKQALGAGSENNYLLSTILQRLPASAEGGA